MPQIQRPVRVELGKGWGGLKVTVAARYHLLSGFDPVQSVAGGLEEIL